MAPTAAAAPPAQAPSTTTPARAAALDLPHDPKGVVPDAVRDEFFSSLKHQSQANKLCFDCGSRNPTWISTSFGIFLCLTCSGNHRNLGAKISFVRSISLDSIKIDEALKMEIGGNARARQYFNSSLGGGGLAQSDRPVNYASRNANRYRALLETEAQNLIQEFLPELPCNRAQPPAPLTKDSDSEDSFLSNESSLYKTRDEVRKSASSSIGTSATNLVVDHNALTQLNAPVRSNKPTAAVVEADDLDFNFDDAFEAGARTLQNPATQQPAKKFAVPVVKRANDSDLKASQYKGASNLSRHFEDEDDEASSDGGAPLSKFKNAQAISSDALFGNENVVDDELATRLAILRENAIQKASEAAVLARGVVRDAAGWFSKVSGQSFGGFQS